MLVRSSPTGRSGRSAQKYARLDQGDSMELRSMLLEAARPRAACRIFMSFVAASAVYYAYAVFLHLPHAAAAAAAGRTPAAVPAPP